MVVQEVTCSQPEEGALVSWRRHWVAGAAVPAVGEKSGLPAGGLGWNGLQHHVPPILLKTLVFGGGGGGGSSASCHSLTVCDCWQNITFHT